jgi:hypothetical protein
MRVCRYTVLDVTEVRYSEPVTTDYDEDEDDYEYCDDCGEDYADCYCDEEEAEAFEAGVSAAASPGSILDAIFGR